MMSKGPPAAIVFLLVLAGCTGLPGDEDQESNLRPLGLGLNIPKELAPPGPFWESRQDIRVLEGFLLGEGAAMLQECGRSQDFRVVEELVATEKHLKAVNALVDICGNVGDADGHLAQQAMDQGNEREKRDQLHERANQSMQAFRSNLSQHPGPGNAVEAQVLDELAKIFDWDHDAVSSALSFWDAYEDGRAKERLQLQNVYLGLMRAHGDANALQMILDRYPWTQPACRGPDIDALAVRVEAKLDHALVLAQEHGDPEDAENVFRHYGGLVIDTIPQFEHDRDQGWWFSLLSLEIQAESHIAYWENLTADAWPTKDEGEYLLAQYRNETRTLWTERFLYPYVRFYYEEVWTQSMVDWHQDTEVGGPALMGSQVALCRVGLSMMLA